MEVIKYPYLPEGRTIGYVPATDKFMELAKAWAKAQSLDDAMPGAAVIVKNDRVLGIGANGSMFHKENGCERVKLGCKSGEGYELCQGCSPDNHSEATAINNGILLQGGSRWVLRDARLYLWGHWWFCKDCWDKMISVQIGGVFVIEGSEVLFNKQAEGNVVGKQFQVA